MAAAGTTAYILSLAPKGPRADLILHKVKYEPVNLTVVERGALESADNRELVCRVKAGNKANSLSIKWVIDDGALVKAGDLLMDIEASALEDLLKTEKIALEQARGNWFAAEQGYKIQEIQNTSDVETAKVNLDMAQMNLKKYLEGDFPQALKDVGGRTKLALADVEIQEERVAWAKRSASRDFLSDGQFKAEMSRFDSLKESLNRVNEEKRVLIEYTKVLMEKDLNSKVEEAQRALERVKIQATAKLEQADKDRQTKKLTFELEQDKYDDIEEQIHRCLITAPQDGMVVYYVSEQSRSGMGSQQSIVAQGESVKEGQKLMRIPDLRRMLVNTKVHEALVSRIKGDVWQPTGFVDTLRAAMFVHPDPLSRMVGQYAMPEIREKLRDHEMQKVSDGMRATIRVDAFPDKVLRGHVKSVATVAAKQDWNSADVKVYQTMIVIEESLDGLKPDMTAEVTIHVDSTGEPVLTVPLQAVIGGTELGRTRKVFVSTTEGPKERDVLIGLSNEKVVEIREGLQENDEVVLNPKVILGDKAKTRQVIDSDRSDGGEGKAKGKGKGGKGKGRSGGPGGPGGGMIPSGPDGGLPGNGGGEAK